MPPLDPRVPVPDAAAIARAERLISEVFAAQLADPTDAGRQALAQDLLAQADDAPTPAERYALLVDARRIAVAAYQPRTAMDAARRVGNMFAIDAAELRLQTLRAFPPPADAVQATALATAAAEACEIALASDHPDVARQALAVIKPSRPQLAGTPVDTQLSAIDRALSGYDQITADLARLSAHPDDPAANVAVGAFEFFVRHDWRRGLPLAAKGSDPALASAARLELLDAGPNDAERLTAIGDAWWDAAATTGRPADQTAELRKHAVVFYWAALPTLRGLERRRVNQRMREAGVPPPTTAPSALMAALPQATAITPVAPVPSQPQRIVFLCDASASMAPVLDQLKGDVERRIDGLTYAGADSQRFNVLFFNDRVIPLTRSTALRTPTPAGKTIAATFIDRQVAAGPSDMLLAVRSTMVYRPDRVVLFTGGITEPGQLAEVLAAFRTANPTGHTRVDCVYVPSHVDPVASDDLGLISKANGGTVTTLSPPPASTAAPTASVERTSRHVLYVCQASGSMVSVFQRLRQDVDTSVGALRGPGFDPQMFNIILFQDDRLTVLSDHGPLPATVENKRLAVQFMSRAFAVGSTQPAAVIRFIANDHPDLVYLYSDGMSQLVGDRAAMEQAFARAVGPKGRVDCMYLPSGDAAAALRSMTDIADLTGGRMFSLRRPGTLAGE